MKPPRFTFTPGALRPSVVAHLIAALSGYFPDGEEMFIRSVRHYLPELEPALAGRVRGFIGQEMSHARAHDRLNTALGERFIVQRLHARRAVLPEGFENLYPPICRLAQTCAMEHFTALFGARMLTGHDTLAAAIGDDAVTDLLTWHAYEEIEHKSVAFDVYRAVGGPEWLRIGVMAVIIAVTAATSLILMPVSLLADPGVRRHPVRAWRGYQAVHRVWWPRIVPELAAYLRPGFHPDRIDTDHLLGVWGPRVEAMITAYHVAP